ncbi:glycosyltransferase [Azospirillum sp. TSO22-1]|uniref:glycosyltransferase family 2 protein n=1 Tax=Azospirillum sp. TSO22-1 TaxID=716789 RepID=UPI000D64B972|nr:glycosyltransferase [Azospirillum sp. TSO22-1]
MRLQQVLPQLLRFAVRHWGLWSLLRRVVEAYRQGGFQLLRLKLRMALNFMVHHQRPLDGPVPASALPPPRPAGLLESTAPVVSLNTRYGLSDAEWTRFLDPVLNEKLIRPAQRLPSRATPSPRLWAVLDLSGGADAGGDGGAEGGDGGPGLDERVAASLAALQSLAEAAEFPVSIVSYGAAAPTSAAESGGAPALHRCATLAEAVALAGDEDLLLFLRPGDAVRAELAAALPVYRLFDRAIVLLDLYYRDREEVHPLFLPGVNYCHALNCDYFRSRFLARGREAKAQLAGSVTPRDLAVRIMGDVYAREDWDAECHLAVPLIELSESTETLRRERTDLVRRRTPLRYPLAPEAPTATDAAGAGSVSVVLCTKDKGHLLRQIVNALLRYPAGLVREVVVVSNQTGNEYALSTLDDLTANPRVHIVRFDQPFNFSRQCNLGVRRTTGEFLLFLNDDIVPISEDWLEELLAPFANPRVGITGPLLVYPDERVQQGGMYLGFNNVAGHTLRFARLPDEDYGFMASAPRFVSVLTGAALVMRRSLFEAMNGFDPLLASYIQDVDLCLRARAVGTDIVFNPRSVLIHMESISVKTTLDNQLVQTTRNREFEIFHTRWSDFLGRDPFHNANFAPSDEGLHTLRLA